MLESVHLTSSAVILSEQNLAEGRPEVGTEDRINDRIQEAVGVAEPTDDADDDRWKFTPGTAEWPD